MSWKKACLIFYIALVVTALANIEKVSVWVDDRLADGPPPAPAVARQVRRVRNLWRDTGLAAASHDIDCALAPFFDETYKNTIACREDPASQQAAKALHDRLDPNQPVLKGDMAVDTAGLLAALAPPRPVSPADASPAAPAVTAQPGSALPALGAANLPTPHKMLVVGDSLAIGLSLSLRRSVAELEGLSLIEEGKVSSGLANPKYYDWGRALRVFLDKYKPDVVVVMMGANDAKYINLNDKPHAAGNGTRTWSEIFASRLDSFIASMQDKGIPNYWIGLPVMGDPTFSKQAEVMNGIIETECGKAGTCHFLDTRSLLTDAQGNYSTFLPNDKGVKIKVRANDKVHFTVAGGDILAQSFLATLAKDMQLRPKKTEVPNAPVSSTP